MPFFVLLMICCGQGLQWNIRGWILVSSFKPYRVSIIQMSCAHLIQIEYTHVWITELSNQSPNAISSFSSSLNNIQLWPMNGNLSAEPQLWQKTQTKAKSTSSARGFVAVYLESECFENDVTTHDLHISLILVSIHGAHGRDIIVKTRPW